MKYCSKCGNELMDEAVICPKCGCAVENITIIKKETKEITGMKTAIKVLMIIACVIEGLYLIPLAWTIPMTVSYCSKIKKHEKISVGFKVCSLIFVSLIAGILMLCDDDN